ncbi:hypothetical protein [Xenorhabdus sp. PB62.4]|uniref:hypothetical protein n=1 Tax=Xenorhabdus sp. PB62.4 TaxID=1851573 RepID=UPI0016570D97|nr:hypothetical protein [Xenorhabdus sp. PB62.4]MBC8952599.1 tail protein [Xenorhabdus sp. PB62.4]
MNIQDKKPDTPISEDCDLVVVPTPEYVKSSVKDAVDRHAKSRNHPDATLREKGFVILNNEVDIFSSFNSFAASIISMLFLAIC